MGNFPIWTSVYIGGLWFKPPTLLYVSQTTTKQSHKGLNYELAVVY